MKIKKFLLYLLVAAPAYTHISCEQTTSDHAITIFVHGTTPIRKFLQYTPIRSRIYCPQGLSLIKNLPMHYHFHTMAQGFVDRNSQLYSLDQFYIFGWKSEQVYNSTRMQSAKNLVQALQVVVDTYYKQHHIIPTIRLIGFSHGGNVILNTANYLPLQVADEQINVEAWLFGTPVQQINQQCVNSPYFKKIHSIYSKKDWIQRMDPQALQNKKCRKNYFWSDRTFNEHSSCIQVNFTVNYQPISHSYYRCIFKHFPTIQQLIQEQSHNINSGMIAINLEI
jgi:predicted esterase